MNVLMNNLIHNIFNGKYLKSRASFFLKRPCMKKCLMSSGATVYRKTVRYRYRTGFKINTVSWIRILNSVHTVLKPIDTVLRDIELKPVFKRISLLVHRSQTLIFWSRSIERQSMDSVQGAPFLRLSLTLLARSSKTVHTVVHLYSSDIYLFPLPVKNLLTLVE